MALRQFSTFLRATGLQRYKWHTLFHRTHRSGAEGGDVHDPFKVKPNGTHSGLIQHGFYVIGHIENCLISHRYDIAQRKRSLDVGHRICNVARLTDQRDTIACDRRKYVVTSPNSRTIKHVHDT